MENGAETFLIGVLMGGLCIFGFIMIQEIPQDARVMRQLAKPCLKQGYTKAKCREMIYIPQSEEMK